MSTLATEGRVTRASQLTASGAGTDLQGRRVLVVGAARSGLSAAAWLARQGARVTLADARDDVDASPLEGSGVAIELGPHRAETFLGAELVVMSPGVSPWLPVVHAARLRGTPVVGELELASRYVRGRIVAVTGTKGKSTTTTLVGRMCEAAGLRVAVGGNIGVPLSAQIDASTPETVHVVEASSFQLETSESFRPWIAVYLNFSPDHLDRHATVEEYRQAKARLFANQREGDVAVVNADDPVVMRSVAGARSRVLPFSLHHGPEPGFGIAGGHVVHRREDGTDEPLVPLSAIRLLGPHLVADVVAASAAAWLAGAPAEALTKAVEEFRGLEHALELVAEVDGVRFVNDSKATNIDAARRSIESFSRGVVPILGGRFKGGEWRDLRDVLRSRTTAVVAIGESAPQVRRAFADLVMVIEAGSMDEAVARARAVAPAGGVVLLAPACASFDMFRDYADRGRAFKEAVVKVTSGA
jgi:UDP-N-acetylmuramoylalanine--D-glutamate ligase